MPPLPNVRQEKFVQGLFEGKSATQSYIDAGYKPHQGNSSRLRWFEMVQERLAELQAEAAKASAITVESICKELDDAVALARTKGQAAAMVAASALKSKIGGLIENRQTVSISVSHRDERAQADDIVARIAAEHGIEDATVVARCFGLDPPADRASSR